MEHPESHHEEGSKFVFLSPHQGGAIVRHIASFLTISDAASMGASSHNDLVNVPSWSSLVTTPETPGLMALSPNENDYHDDDDSGNDMFDDECIHKRLQDRQRRYVTQKLAAAVFAHPQSLRQFCVVAHKAAMNIQRKREHTYEIIRKKSQPNLLHFVVQSVLQNVPLSVLMHLLDAVRETLFFTSCAGIDITLDSIHSLVTAVTDLLSRVWHMVTNLQFSNATEVLASGIQSVATGVPSALNRLSRDHYGVIDISSSMTDIAANRDLLLKLTHINAAAHVISYREREDEAISKHAKKRVQRMIQYEVSLRPFLATVVAPVERKEVSTTDVFENVDFPTSHSLSPLPSPGKVSPRTPLMFTPKSFPVTPASRSFVMAQSTRFAEDVIFLARDKLRVEDGLDSDNDRTRAMASALRDACRLAVFDAADIGGGIVLTCGQHVATKGNVEWSKFLVD